MSLSIYFDKVQMMKELDEVMVKQHEQIEDVEDIGPAKQAGLAGPKKRGRGRPKKYHTKEEFEAMKKAYMQNLKETGYFKRYYQNRKKLLNQPEIYEIDINY